MKVCVWGLFLVVGVIVVEADSSRGSGDTWHSEGVSCTIIIIPAGRPPIEVFPGEFECSVYGRQESHIVGTWTWTWTWIYNPVLPITCLDPLSFLCSSASVSSSCVLLLFPFFVQVPILVASSVDSIPKQLWYSFGGRWQQQQCAYSLVTIQCCCPGWIMHDKSRTSNIIIVLIIVVVVVVIICRLLLLLELLWFDVIPYYNCWFFYPGTLKSAEKCRIKMFDIFVNSPRFYYRRC